MNEFLERIARLSPSKRRLLALRLAHASGVLRASRMDNAGIDESNDKRLIAYIVPNAEDMRTTALRDHLAARLPSYMIPSHFVQLEALPLMPNGKVDRNALPDPEAMDAVDASEEPEDKEHIEPRNDLERQMVELWEEVLNTQPVGVTDDFFELGGHSLLAARLFAEIEKRFDIRLPIASLYREATAAHLSKLVGQQKGYTDWYSLASLQMHGSKTPFYILHGTGGCVGDYKIWSHYLGRDQPFFGLGARGYGSEPPYETIEEMAAHYLEEIRSIQSEGPYFLGGYEFGGVVAFEMAQQLYAQGQRDTLLIIINSEAPGSNYRRVQFNSQFVRGFVGNLPHWVADWLHLNPDMIRGRIMDHIRRLRPVAQTTAPVKANAFTTRRDRLIAANERALTRYQPRVYPGRIVLLRNQRQPLVCSFDPTMGWNTLSSSGVIVKPIPGSMTTILSKPEHARAVADVLHDCFDDATLRRNH